MIVIKVEVQNPTAPVSNNSQPSLLAIMLPFPNPSDPSMPELPRLISPNHLIPINPSHSGQFMGMATSTTAASAVPVVYRDSSRQVHPQSAGFQPMPPLHPPIIYFNVGPAPGPCMICQYSPNGEPRSIFLQHCIPQCPAIVTSRNLVFATSDYIRRNDVRPCVLYLPGTTIPSSVPEDINEIPPIYVGLFTLPNPQNVRRLDVRRQRPYLGNQGHVGSYAYGSNLTNPFWNVYNTFTEHAPPPHFRGFQIRRPR